MIDNQDVADVIRNAENVSVYRLARSHESRLQIDDYAVEEGPIMLSPEQRDELQTLFLTARGNQRPPVSCLPDYRIQLHFEDGSNSADILLCLECRLLAIYRNGKAITATDFEPVARPLTVLAKNLFPNDVGIQAVQTPR